MIKGLILNYNYKDSFTDRDKKNTLSDTKMGNQTLKTVMSSVVSPEFAKS